ncbi:hypothetical protein D7V97_11820 [Corallococcus sp. CA053C]|uniref:hypothetical protein n=1 Tax=Corallococcus sp. CA053C TaxID=2316732 RepID=UPI000EA14D75|nr:hypothetical protein [Corallococcus sp. CA053C]RKH11165.1 hypothetical protein D7V97_11820 [Corallococcus sp. CA053C]
MSLIIQTANPQALLDSIRKAIDSGVVQTWSYDTDGDFTHTPEQWARKAWLKPHVAPGVLSLGLLGPKGGGMTTTVYGVYHGRFIEMLLTHFPQHFTHAGASAWKDTAFDVFT